MTETKFHFTSPHAKICLFSEGYPYAADIYEAFLNLKINAMLPPGPTALGHVCWPQT